MLKKRYTGKIVEIFFKDHCLNSGMPVKEHSESLNCIMYGKVIKQTKSVLMVAYWLLISGDKATRLKNMETAAIVVSTISSINYLNRSFGEIPE